MYSYRQIEARWPDHGIADISERARGDDADTEIALLHLIEPNTGYEDGRLDAAGKKFRSVTGAKAETRRKASSFIAAGIRSSRRSRRAGRRSATMPTRRGLATTRCPT